MLGANPNLCHQFILTQRSGEHMKTKTTSPYHEIAETLIKKGLVVIPLRADSKIPLLPEWTSFTKEQSKKQLEVAGGFNIGLLLGEPSGIVALDFDIDMDNLHRRILKVCGQSDVVKKGAKGGTIFFRFDGEKAKKWKRNGEMVLELLSTGNQTVIPPSIHPDTMEPYIYTKGKSLADIVSTDLPFLPKDFISKMDELFEGKTPMMTTGSNLDIASEALYFIEADDYDTWLKCGMALKNEFMDEGFEVWEKWSLTNDKCKPEELFPKWKSFKGGGITTATIFQMAIKNGYNPPKNAGNFYNVNNIKAVMQKWRVKGRFLGWDSGIEAFDKLLHIRRREFTVVTGRPGSGKSEFLDFLVHKLSKENDLKTMLISFENTPEDHAESFVHRAVGKDLQNRTMEDEILAIQKIQDNIFFYEHERASKDIDSLLERAKEVRKNQGLDILVIDPYCYLTSKDIANEFANARYICLRLSNFAKENNIHVFLVAHPKTLDAKKVTQGRAPALTLYSISGGATFYNVIDNGIIISRDTDNNDVEVDIQKVKKQAVDSTGTFLMSYDKPTREFVNYKGEF